MALLSSAASGLASSASARRAAPVGARVAPARLRTSTVVRADVAEAATVAYKSMEEKAVATAKPHVADERDLRSR